MPTPTSQLLPNPRQLTPGSGSYTLINHKLILLDSDQPRELRFAAKRLQSTLHEKYGLAWDITASAAAPGHRIGLACRVRPQLVQQPQGYELEITPDAISITAHDEAGVFYAVCTLKQIVENSAPELPCLRIVDWPDFSVRGVMLDVSRDRVPTMETLYDLVDRLAGWKINQLQLYTEHTFAYYNHPEVWEQASPLTGQEILDLDEYCRLRYIELVPNQNSFGHMKRWLKHTRYAPLAETTTGYQAPWGPEEGAYSLCPVDPHSLRLLGELYDELLPHFSSRLFNVGCDETFDLGQGRSRQVVAERGEGRVYLEFLLHIYRLVQARGKTMQFWGDIVLQHPELIPELPKDMIALEWGYEANYPFEANSARFDAAGIPFYVCPGTSSWSSLGGRTENALGNLLSAAEAGIQHNAVGYLITDWGDGGHWQPLPISYLGFLVGAAYSWSLESNRALDVPSALSRYAFNDAAGVMGLVAYNLGNVYNAYGLRWEHCSILFATLQRTLEKIRIIKLVNREGYCRALEAIDAAIAPLGQAQMERLDATLVQREFLLVAWMMRHACWRGLLALEEDATRTMVERRRLAADLDGLIEEFRTCWLARSRPGGLKDSLAYFEKPRADYRMGVGC